MYPDFLCIGAQKAGTTWLDLNLRHHPHIKMTPVKEIHFFDDPSIMPTITKVITERWWRILLKDPLQRFLKEGRKGDLQWFLRFFFLHRDENWYSSLFTPGVGQISGEITPGYATLKENIVARIQDLMPNLRIIYLLRNPILRTWSQTAMHFRDRGRKLEDVKDEQLDEFFKLDWVSRHSDYLRNLEKWEKYYPENQFFIGFIDQLAGNPRDFLRNIYNFLEVDSSQKVIPDNADKKIYSHQYSEIPTRFARYLAYEYYDTIERLHTRFANRYTADWLKFAEKFL
jgi:hypothetical protein